MVTINPDLQQFLGSKPLKMFIDGQWVDSLSGETLETRDPGDGSIIAEVAAGSGDDIDRAVQAGWKAFHHSGWATMPSNDRAVILHRLADLIDRNLELLTQIESLDVGKPLGQARSIDIPQAAMTLRYYADLSVRTRRSEPIAISGFEARTVYQPYWVCAFIFPWNFPFLLVNWGIAPALAAGNTVVIKPAEDTPLSTLFLCRLAEEAGVPKGVVNVVTGFGETAGAALTRHTNIKRMSFTGSPEVGRMVAESCGRNLVPVKLELGGKGAGVVLNDVDVEATAQALSEAVTFNAGQVCCTATRWLIQEDIWDKFLDKAKQTLTGMKIGHGSDPATDIGPVVSEKQRSRILGYLEKGVSEGAECLLEGGRATVEGHEGGYYVKPALLTGDSGNICARDEIFGPVAYLMPFKSEEEAVELVNLSDYGLGNSVWTTDLDRANRVAEAMVAGNSWINGHNLATLGVPYGGANKSGMGGGVLGPDTLMDYYRSFSVTRPLD